MATGERIERVLRIRQRGTGRSARSAVSGSRGNYIALLEPPEEQFGKTMRLPDELLPNYYKLVMESDEDPLAGDAMAAKLRLARFIVTRAHGEEAARAAEEHFTRVVREGQAPEEVPAVLSPNRQRAAAPAARRGRVVCALLPRLGRAS